MIRPLFRRTGKLGQKDDRHVQFTGQELEGPGGFRHPEGLTFPAAAHIHLLQVVDDDQVQARLGFEPAALAAHLRHGTARGVVDVDVGAGDGLQGLGKAQKLFVGDIAGAHRLHVYPAFRAEHPLHQLFPGHFQGKNAYGFFAPGGGVLGDVQGKGGFAHAGPGRQDDQVPGL